MGIGPKKFIGFLLLLAGLTSCGVGLWLLLSPAQYQATTRIEVNPDVTDAIQYGQAMSFYLNSALTNIEVIQSAIVLGKVADALNLNVLWGRKYNGGGMLATNESIAILKKHLHFAIERNPKLLAISYTGENPDEAAGIANAIANAYQEYLLERWKQEILNGIRVLTDEFEKEGRNIEAKQVELTRMRNDLNVPNPEPVDELLKTNFHSFFQAKQELQKMLELHKLLQAKIASEQIDLRLPMVQMATIIEIARPPKSPVGPNRFLGAALLAIGLLSAAGGFLMLKSSHHPV